ARTVITRLNAQVHASASWRRESLSEVRSEPATLPSEEDDITVRLMLEDALSSLPARQRNAVYLRYWQGWSTGQIALALQTPGGTVRSDLARAIAQLRRVLSLNPPAK
ncbi:MAG TPA: sigma-70 family RNA polymerase sigma factor, partial [Trebonia sp.]|nr:sigma-70 family RNA polymerase sigma factor [Trebonia sp.]